MTRGQVAEKKYTQYGEHGPAFSAPVFFRIGDRHQSQNFFAVLGSVGDPSINGWPLAYLCL